MDIYFLPSLASHPGAACPYILIVCLRTTKHHNARKWKIILLGKYLDIEHPYLIVVTPRGSHSIITH